MRRRAPEPALRQHHTDEQERCGQNAQGSWQPRRPAADVWPAPRRGCRDAKLLTVDVVRVVDGRRVHERADVVRRRRGREIDPVWPESNVPPVRLNCCSSPARVRSSTAAAHRTCTTGARSKLKRSAACAAAASSRVAHATATAYWSGLAFAIVSNQIRRRRLRSQLPQHRHHLSAMVGAVIHDVLEGMRERLRLADAVAHVFERLIDADLAEPLQDRMRFGSCASHARRIEARSGKRLRVGKRGRRFPLPSRTRSSPHHRDARACRGRMESCCPDPL